MKRILVFFASLMPALLLVGLVGSTPMPENEANPHLCSYTTGVQLANSPHQGEGVFICRPHQGDGFGISKS